MSAKMTPAEVAYAAFAARPLAARFGVDRASFLAGYDTAMENNAVPDLIAALQECSEYGALTWADDPNNEPNNEPNCYLAARAALAKAGAL